MQVTCPDCQSQFPGSSGRTQTCPACMHAFELGGDSRLPGVMTLELQGANGEALGVFDRIQLRQMIYSGTLSGKEYIRQPPSDWQPIYERADLLDLFKLMGVDLVKIQLSTQRIQGWRKDESAGASATKKVQKSMPESAEGRTFQAPKATPSVDPQVWKILALALFGFGVLMWKFL
jgi:hypothetical protein